MAQDAASHPGFTPMLLTLPSLTPSLALEVLPYGLTLHRLFVQADGKTHDILIGPEVPAEHLVQKYTNTIIGRYANRVPAGTHAVSRNGFSASFTAQHNESPGVSLHGGKTGFDLVPWEPLLDPSAAKLFTPAELQTLQSEVPASCIYTRVSEDGEEGYPGRLLVEVLVGLLQPQGPPAPGGEYNLGSVLLVYRAKLLDANTVTPVNLTQHWGFNLDASLQEGLSVKDHKLTIKAIGQHACVYTELLSAGSLAPVKGTHHEHSGKKIGDAFESGYDEFYVFSPRSTPAAPTRITEAEFTPALDLLKSAVDEQREAVVELASERSGLRLTFDTNQSGVQFYTNNFSTPEKTARKKIHGGSGAQGDGYDAGSAAFLEFHEPLAAWLHPETRGPSGSDTLLASGEVYNNVVRMDVWYRSPGL
ncbi:galactose mutarotase-like protein [Amylocystis lapponica]|nr:galactose mutarotase-like protein [Amylocystis lapponica]